jgi:hypothetical protein
MIGYLLNKKNHYFHSSPKWVRLKHSIISSTLLKVLTYDISLVCHVLVDLIGHRLQSFKRYLNPSLFVNTETTYLVQLVSLEVCFGHVWQINYVLNTCK